MVLFEDNSQWIYDDGFILYIKIPNIRQQDFINIQTEVCKIISEYDIDEVIEDNW